MRFFKFNTINIIIKILLTGAFYFGCRPGHGVFAPCHKVQIEAVRRQTEGKGINEKGKASLIARAESVSRVKIKGKI